VIKHAIRN